MDRESFFKSFIASQIIDSDCKMCNVYLQVEITAGPQLYVHTGSRLQLECVVSRVVEAPQWVMWQHGNTVTPGLATTYTTGMGLVTKSVLTIDQVNMTGKVTSGEWESFQEVCMPRHECKQPS